MSRGVLFSFVALLFPVCIGNGAEIRTWRDKTGQHTLPASLLEFCGGEVLLKKAADGSHISISVFRLWNEDIAWLQENVQPKPLILPPIPLDLATLKANEDQRVDLTDALPGIDDYSIVSLTITGAYDVQVDRNEIPQPGGAVVATLSSFPGATIELRRGRDGHFKTLFLRPRLEIGRGVDICFSNEAIRDWTPTLLKHISDTERDLQTTQGQLRTLPLRIREAQSRLRTAGNNAERAQWTANLHGLNKEFNAAQGRAPTLQKRLGDLQQRRDRCNTALRWLEQHADRLAVNFRIESRVSERWLLPVARTWNVEDAQSLGALAEVAADWRQLAHRWRKQRIGDQEMASFVDQVGRRIANREVTIQLKIADTVATDAQDSQTLFVSPVHRLAGVEYPRSISPALLGAGSPPAIGELVTVSGSAAIHQRTPQLAPTTTFRQIGEQVEAPAKVPPSVTEPVLTLGFQSLSVGNESVQMWMQVRSATNQVLPKQELAIPAELSAVREYAELNGYTRYFMYQGKWYANDAGDWVEASSREEAIAISARTLR
ncbi:MAG: hypothetical protein KJ000_11585 [Pirellulaceae bacterium]|nr:hypothetical protein [Pirellulaceae bacterium]